MGIYEDSRKLEEIFHQPKGTFLATRTTLGIIREKIKAMTASGVPLPCQQLSKTYDSMLQRANNAVSGGGSPSNFDKVWGNFIAAALALVECLNKQKGAAG